MDVTCGTSDRVARAVVYGCGHSGCTRDERSIFSLEIPEPGLRAITVGVTQTHE